MAIPTNNQSKPVSGAQSIGQAASSPFPTNQPRPLSGAQSIGQAASSPLPTNQVKPVSTRPLSGAQSIGQAANQSASSPKLSGMDAWRAANPKLAAAADEKARIRGTAQTDNPLMRGMRSRLPLNSPSVQSPNVATLGRGNQSLVNNPNAIRAAVPAVQPTAASTPIASKPIPSSVTTAAFAPSAGNLVGRAATTPVASKPLPAVRNVVGPRTRSQMLNQGMEYDAFDIILEYLTSGGHVDTLEEALYVMLEMDEYTISNIMEEYHTSSLYEEINEWINSLVYEGYDLSNYTWDEVAKYYINEARVDQGKTPQQKEKDRNERSGVPNPSSAQQHVTFFRKHLHQRRQEESRRRK